MTALWIGILAGATGVAALVIAFFADRRTRRAIERIQKMETAPRAVGDVLTTRSGERIAFDDLKGKLTLLVNVPAQGIDPHRMARLESVRHRFGAGTLDVLAVPIGDESGSVDETPQYAGAIPVLATVDRNPLADVVKKDFADVDAYYTKLLVDGEGRVVARFSPDTDPRGVEVRRAVEAAQAN